MSKPVVVLLVVVALGVAVFLLVQGRLPILSGGFGDHVREGPVELPDPVVPEEVIAEEAPAPPVVEARSAAHPEDVPVSSSTLTEKGRALFEQIAELTGRDLHVTEAAEEAVGDIEVTMQLDDVSAATVLDLITEPYELTWTVDGSSLWIGRQGEELPGRKR